MISRNNFVLSNLVTPIMMYILSRNEGYLKFIINVPRVISVVKSCDLCARIMSEARNTVCQKYPFY